MAVKFQYRLLWLAVLVTCAFSHTYYLGNCPTVEPVENFNIDKFLGRWYVIQKFSTASSCWTYDFVRNSTDSSLKVIQIRDHVILDTVGLDNNYRYAGNLEVPDSTKPAAMKVSFPLSVGGKADYVVFATDYDSYAAVYSCQKILFGHRRSASILSRKPQLDLIYVNKLRSKLESFGVDPHDFTIVSHDDCHNISSSSLLNFGVGPGTFSAENVAGVVQGAGQAIGTGIGSVAGVVRDAGQAVGTGIGKAAEGATRIYNRVSGGKAEDLENDDPKKDVEWVSPVNPPKFNSP